MKIRILVVALFALCSCKVNRNMQKFSRTVDSTGFFKKDSVAVKRVDSSVTTGTVKVVETEKKNDYQKVTVIEEYNDTPVIKRITITETDKGVKKVTTKTVTQDSTGLKKVDSIAHISFGGGAVMTDESGKDIQVKKTQGGAWINIGLALLGVIVLAATGYYLYKKYWR